MYEVLRQFVPSPADQVEALASAGGFSGARFWRVRSGAQVLCLRCWPRQHPNENRLTFIHRVLQHVAGSGIPWLPVPLPSLKGATFVRHGGVLWELTLWLPGAAELSDPPAPQRLTAAMRALARFHLAAASYPGGAAGFPPGWRQRYELLIELQSGQLDRILSAVRSRGGPKFPKLADRYATLFPAVAPRVRRRLEAKLSAKVALQPSIRDVRRDHVLFVEDSVTGLIDFGAMRIDCPNGDVARLLGSFSGDCPELCRTALDAYSEIRRLTNDDEERVATYDACNVLMSAANWFRWYGLENRQFEQPEATISLIEGWLRRLSVAADDR